MTEAHFTEESVPMSNETRGHAIKKRRIGLGFNALEDFARASGVGRNTIAKAEKGDPTVKDSTYLQLETWLDNWDTETTSEAEDVAAEVSALEVEPQNAPASGNITIQLSEGGSITVAGPVRDAAELEAIAARLLRIQIEERRATRSVDPDSHF